MDEAAQKQITEHNENRVRAWFEKSGFASERLDTHSSGEGKRVDWQFTKDGVVAICEVKTIFSGGQFGTVKEREHQNFEQAIKADLLSDQELHHLPFDVTLAIDKFHTAHRAGRSRFISWLKQHIRWASTYYRKGFYQLHSACTYDFDPSQRNGPQALVQITGPNSRYALEVGFIRGGADYNEDALARAIRHEAVPQLRATLESGTLDSAIPMIAFCSESNYLRFTDLFVGRREVARYDLFDWAFSEFQDTVTAILLLDTVPAETETPPQNFWDWAMLSITGTWVEIGYVLTSPYKDREISMLRNAITTEDCWFIVGMTQQ